VIEILLGLGVAAVVCGGAVAGAVILARNLDGQLDDIRYDPGRWQAGSRCTACEHAQTFGSPGYVGPVLCSRRYPGYRNPPCPKCGKRTAWVEEARGVDTEADWLTAKPDTDFHIAGLVDEAAR
jgi:hypothetical protein